MTHQSGQKWMCDPWVIRLGAVVHKAAVSKVASTAAVKRIGSGELPNSTIVALGKMPESAGTHGQIAEHRQWLLSGI